MRPDTKFVLRASVIHGLILAATAAVGLGVMHLLGL